MTEAHTADTGGRHAAPPARTRRRATRPAGRPADRSSVDVGSPASGIVEAQEPESATVVETVAQPAADEAPAARGSLVTVFSPKGGVGKTTISVNLAHAVRAAGNTVCLVDLDVEFGDVAIVSGLLPVHTIADAVGSDCDDAVLDEIVTTSDAGVDCVLAPVDPVVAETITPALVSSLLDALRGRYDVVVVDTAPQLSECVLEALVAADHLVVVTTPDLPSIKNTRLALDTLQLLDIAARTRTLVLNQYGRRNALPVDDIAEALQVPSVIPVPDDDAVPMSIDEGVPLQISDTDHPVSMAVRRLAAATVVDISGVGRTRRFRLGRKGVRP